MMGGSQVLILMASVMWGFGLDSVFVVFKLCDVMWFVKAVFVWV